MDTTRGYYHVHDNHREPNPVFRHQVVFDNPACYPPFILPFLSPPLEDSVNQNFLRDISINLARNRFDELKPTQSRELVQETYDIYSIQRQTVIKNIQENSAAGAECARQIRNLNYQSADLRNKLAQLNLGDSQLSVKADQVKEATNHQEMIHRLDELKKQLYDDMHAINQATLTRFSHRKALAKMSSDIDFLRLKYAKFQKQHETFRAYLFFYDRFFDKTTEEQVNDILPPPVPQVEEIPPDSKKRKQDHVWFNETGQPNKTARFVKVENID